MQEKRARYASERGRRQPERARSGQNVDKSSHIRK